MARKKKIIEPLEHCSSIREYEKSPYWRAKSKALLEDTSLVCPICGRPRFVWQTRKKIWKRKLTFCVHHTTYKNVPNEKPEDLIILCSTCHNFCHKALKYQNLGRAIGPINMYQQIAKIVKKYFIYKKRDIKENTYFQNKENK